MYVNDNAQQTSMSTSPSYSYLRSTSNQQSHGDVIYDDIRIMDRHQVYTQTCVKKIQYEIEI